MKPVIGVTIIQELDSNNTYEKVNKANLNAIAYNGGIPIMLPITDNEEIIDRYVEMVDGIFFTGGNDINPLIFGEEPIRELGEIEFDRDEFEIKLYKKAAAANMPILGICRGMQLINVAAGGTLYQDIYTQRSGTNNHSPSLNFGGYEHHSISIRDNTKLFEILNTNEIKTNSYHHQAVKDIAEGFVATAFAKDGIVEGIESTNFNFVVGVQWHPEVMYEKYPVYSSLFKELIEAAKVFGR